MSLATNAHRYTSLAWALWATRDIDPEGRIAEIRRRLHCTDQELAALLDTAGADGIVIEGPEMELTAAGEFLGSQMSQALQKFPTRDRRRRNDFTGYVPNRWYPDA